MNFSRASVSTLVALTVLLTLAVTANIAFSQVAAGTISGRVTDPTGAVMPGVMVQILNVDTGYSRTEQTDSAGRYAARELPLGTYRATVQQLGFRTEVQSGVVVTVGSEMTTNFQLTVGNIQEKVEVSAEAPQVETTNATISGLISHDQIQDLPLNGRSVDQLALLSPGVFRNYNTFSNPAVGSGIRLSVFGSRPDSMLYLLDGTATNDATNNGHGSAAGETLGVDSILEFRMLTHSYSVEYGRFAGGVVSAVTRSGTNQFHGSVYEFVRNTIFDARNFFNPGGLPAFQRNQFGASAGGRIVKDHIFFFANYEGLRQRQGVTVIATVPDANARQGILPNGKVIVSPSVVPYLNLYPLPNGPNNGDGTANYISNFSSPNTEDYAMERMDFRLSDKDSFYWRYVYDPSSAVSPLTVPTFDNAVLGTDHLLVASETHVFSGASINEFRFGFNRTYAAQFSSSLYPVSPSLSFVPGGNPFGTISFASASQSTGVLSTLGASMGSGTGEVQNSFEEVDTYSTVRGPHSLKFGVDFVRQQLNDSYNSNALGNYTFGGLQGLLLAQPTQFRVLVTSSTSFNERGWRRNIFGAFAQDDYRIRPNLTLNIGLREEFITNPAEANGRTGHIPYTTAPANVSGPPFVTPKLNLAPRLGVAWDPTGSGKTSIRVGGGIYYNNLEGRNWYGNATINPDYLFSSAQANPPFPNAFAAGLPKGTQQNYQISYNSNTPTVFQYNFEVQRQLASTLSLRVGYIGTHGYHLSREAELNTRVPVILADGTQFFPATNPLTNTHFSTMQNIFTDGLFNYNAFQIVLQKTLSAGLTFQVSETYGRALSDADLTVTGQANSTQTGTMVPFDPHRDYSLSAYDQRNLVVANFSYQMPWDKYLTSKVMKGIFGGWTTNGIFTYDTGIPMTVLDGFNRSQNNDTSNSDDRPNLAANANNNPINGVTSGCTGVAGGQNLQTANRWFDPCAFALQTTGFYGNLARNTITAPGVFNVDFTLVKVTPIRENIRLEFRAECFNLLNHAIFGIPNMTLFGSTGARSGNAGQITGTNIDNREFQLGMKLMF